MYGGDCTIEQVNAMSHEELARRWRFDPAGSWHNGDPVTERAKERLNALGGITAEISKKLGWVP